jgi:alkanesulfonate monooxygenase SsuD/methylene tetrahydromethanopterin reductase-like flavin-dependent oxidoreductase (luciferase family)
MLASVDHIIKGCIGWNAVTSMFDAEARNRGMDVLPSHDQRYSRAAEFIEVAL